MPIISSNIIADSKQADGRRWVTEEHVDSGGVGHRVTYMSGAQADAESAMNARVASVDESLSESEISRYINRIERGLNVVGLDYTETDQAQRALRFMRWAKEKAQSGDHGALRYAHLIIDQFTEGQIDALLGAGKGAKVKAWAEKLRNMKQSMDESAVAAGEV